MFVSAWKGNPCMHICAHVLLCACLLFLCVCVGVMHLQTGGTHVPVHAEAGVQAADWPPQQTTPPCATPGCPQYLKTISIHKRMM